MIIAIYFLMGVVVCLFLAKFTVHLNEVLWIHEGEVIRGEICSGCEGEVIRGEICSGCVLGVMILWPFIIIGGVLHCICYICSWFLVLFSKLLNWVQK